MKKLALITLLFGSVAQLGTGCIIISDDDGGGPIERPDAYVPPPPPPPDAYVPIPGDFVIEWELLAGDNDTVVTCPPGSDDIAVIIDPDPNVDNDETCTLFDCSAGSDLTGTFPPGLYDIQVKLGVYNSDCSEVELHAESNLEVDVDLGDGERITVPFSFSVDRAFISLAWDITVNDAPASCDDVDVDSQVVSILSTAGSDGTGYDVEIDCTVGEGVSPKLPFDEYVVSVSLIDVPGGGVIPGHDPVNVPNVVLEYGNQYNDLGTVTLPVVTP
ncbi:hypothetical protein [Haliangium sp.]|uniref:hypothetical protein n=1 Tax=Haliangium sp. TaxID=2663208 RepID=UPI003D1382F1